MVAKVTRLAAADGIGEDRVACNDQQDEAGSNEDNDQRSEGRSGLVDGQLAQNHILKRRPTSQYLYQCPGLSSASAWLENLWKSLLSITFLFTSPQDEQPRQYNQR